MLAMEGPTGAVFSDDQLHRYLLWRVWDDTLPNLVWVMLNPSTADAEKNDPTIRKTIQFAKNWGFGSVVITNLYAYRATKPTDLWKAPAPIGELNDLAIRKAADHADTIMVAWGAQKQALVRSAAVIDLMKDRMTYALGITKDGHPLHPLYVPYSNDPVRFS